jgi:hypothetical protein
MRKEGCWGSDLGLCLSTGWPWTGHCTYVLGASVPCAWEVPVAPWGIAGPGTLQDPLAVASVVGQGGLRALSPERWQSPSCPCPGAGRTWSWQDPLAYCPVQKSNHWFLGYTYSLLGSGTGLVAPGPLSWLCPVATPCRKGTTLVLGSDAKAGTSAPDWGRSGRDSWWRGCVSLVPGLLWWGVGGHSGSLKLCALSSVGAMDSGAGKQAGGVHWVPWSLLGVSREWSDTVGFLWFYLHCHWNPGWGSYGGLGLPSSRSSVAPALQPECQTL